ncbi:hypothetical protein [Vibrio ouci]|uniref:hypothetical protein n=1 Tax=Vibrio ouci TaxID=2499078 RepID=UPI00142D8583|nr:hypothetical protein [Vibrio ouci]
MTRLVRYDNSLSSLAWLASARLGCFWASIALAKVLSLWRPSRVISDTMMFCREVVREDNFRSRSSILVADTCSSSQSDIRMSPIMSAKSNS